jgi:ankyrin repeat protein/Ran GTPase-activating protein (RanGAP) involved in mRNA processing and transport
MPSLETIIQQLECFEIQQVSLQAEDKPEGELATRFWQALLNNRNLTCLHLQGWGFSEVQLKALVDCIHHNSALKELHLDHNQLGDVAMALLSPALANSHLQTLSLNSNQITAKGVAILAETVLIQGQGTLQGGDSYLMYIDNNDNKSIKAKVNDLLAQGSLQGKNAHMYFIDNRSTFSYLYLKDGELQEPEKINQKLEKEANMQAVIERLKKQYPDKNTLLFKLSAENVQDITSNTSHIPLQTLLLGNNRLEDAGLAPLLQALPSTSLQSLSLARNGLTAAGAATLAAWLQQTGGIRNLFLAANFWGDEGAKALAQALPTAQRLGWLVLEETGLGDSGLAALSETLPQAPTLTRCDLGDYNPRLTEPALEHLEQRLAPKKQLQRSYQLWLQEYYLERAILRYDQGYYQHAIATLEKVLRLKPNHSVARFYHDRAVLADIQQRLENYRQLLVDQSSDVAQQQIKTALQGLILNLQKAEKTFKQAWQTDLLPAEKMALTQQGRSYHVIWQMLAELLQQPELSPWHSALRRGKEAVLQQLLSYGYDINYPLNAQGVTALHEAASQSNKRQVLWLLKHGAQANIRDNNWQFPADYVPDKNRALQQHLRDVHYEHMLKAETKSLQLLARLEGNPALTDQELQCLRHKIQEIQDNLVRLDQLYERSCHHSPKEKPRLEVLYQQYRKAYEPLWNDPNQLPKFYQQSEAQRQAQEDALLQKMLALNPAPDNQATAEQAELLGCYNELSKIVMDLRFLKAAPIAAYQRLQAQATHANWWTPDSAIGVPAAHVKAAFVAVEGGDPLQLTELLDDYPRVLYARSAQGHTLLHAVAGAGQAVLLKWLLQHLPLTLLDSEGETPLHQAARRGQTDCVGVLLTARANLAQPNTKGITAFELALTSSQSNDATATMFMSQAGDFLFSIDANGNTWLHRLIQGQHPHKRTLAEKLHHAGLDLETSNAQDDTPLHLAAKENIIEVVLYLLDSKVDDQRKNNQGKSPLRIAFEGSDPRVTLLLQQAVSDRRFNALSQQIKDLTESTAVDTSKVQNLIADHQILMADHEQRQAELQTIKIEMQAAEAKQQVWEQLIAEPNRKAFYHQTKAKLTSMLGAAKVLYSDWIGSTRKGGLSLAADAIDLLGHVVPLPNADKLIALVTWGLRYQDGQQQQKKTARVANTVDSFQAIDQLAEDVAHLLSERYQEQLLHLTESSVRHLADCAVGRMMAFIEKHPLDERPLATQLLEAVAWYSAKQGRFACINKTLTTLDERDGEWTDEGLLQRSGICLPDGRRFVKPGSSRPEKYGFRLGTETEVDSYQLEPHPDAPAIGWIMNMGIARGDFRLPALTGLPAEGEAALVAVQQSLDELSLPEEQGVIKIY